MKTPYRRRSLRWRDFLRHRFLKSHHMRGTFRTKRNSEPIKVSKGYNSIVFWF